MAIITKQGSLLDAKGIIVHGCNCQGVMGSGVALAIKNKWPQVYDMYRSYKQDVGLHLGGIHIIDIPGDQVTVINAMTQLHYGTRGSRYVSYDAIVDAFARIKAVAGSRELPVNFPLIGAGLGGGDWEIISTIINRTLGNDIEKYLWVQ